MTDLADFLATALPRQVETESAWHQRDLDARLALWSTREPVTLLGAGGACRSGSDEVRRIFRSAVTQIVACRSFDYDMVAAGVGGERWPTRSDTSTPRSVDEMLSCEACHRD
jgi:hypothetical protein